jgi:A/G-specific adenine glycosylase
VSASGGSRGRAKVGGGRPRRGESAEATPCDLGGPRPPVAERRAALVDALLGWFDRSARDLPWRRTRDPYAIWLSEVMLQQTSVDTVIPYYERFLATWPTVHALAEAPLEDVLVRWSGLGYYRRARQLHLAAREVIERHGGSFPRTVPELRRLSGVGDYTAGAVASIAFDEPTPLVDGNVIRVLSRIFVVGDDMRSVKGRERIWALAGALVPLRRAGAFNQSLMELGSQVCTPRSPSCEGCPVRGSCSARASGRVDELPRMAPKKAPRAESLVATVVRSGESVFVARRREGGLFGGMWEPPLGKDVAEAERTARTLGVEAGARLECVGTVRHVLTHRRLSIEVYRAELPPKGTRGRKPKASSSEGGGADAALDATYDAVELRRPSEVALSTLAKKLLAAAGVSLALALTLTLTASVARAEVPASTNADEEAGLAPGDLARYRELAEPRGRYARILTTVGAGRGLRFNNPYRLRTQLGSTAESLSLTAPYVDLGLGLGFGNPFGLQHGPLVHVSVATEGVAQTSLSASYQLLHRGSSAWLGYGRVGAALLTSPDPNVGLEAGAGVSRFLTGAVGLNAEVVFDLFYGAGTYETRYTVIPVVSLQLGLMFDLEVLP